jgi:hypothetical protein
LIRNRNKENEVDSIIENEDTKTLGNETLKSRQMTPRKGIDIKDDSIKSFGFGSDKVGM